ncbi:type I-B CRISPR-associated protein Cas7/Csh2 [Tepiditoga spiralis]|uniref:Type I-B CRISPR-associated protein Cas7/Csh2 n=1 Tax=Tepiditoga spiralis TaxID=2108365 RepID=A0A7G1G5S5_9BACT|nr:type I-B CRISPR-associated protein Cas7/Csh2 [Tepiditoga spiralis]BBE30404.1 type I-B CRISPR-associated protein Cas7/Csh2 [Tepiditoga spiralis]
MYIEKRSELLFCYDITDANPNGDPLDNNKPRIDEETSINFVTDVRLKRTIRDYLYEYKGYNGENNKDIFVREIIYDDKNMYIQDGKKRAGNFENNANDILNKCIDVRLFGGVIPLSKDSITYTGPIQFKVGRSLHQVELQHIKGTGAFASKQGTKQNTFREEYILPYSFIAFHGIINETAAKHTSLSEEDVDLLLDGMWNGTKNLISRSKFGQMPRLLIKVDYKEKGYFIGDLDKYIKIKTEKLENKIRKLEDFTLDISKLLEVFEEEEEKIDKISYKVDKFLNIIGEIPSTWEKLEI